MMEYIKHKTQCFTRYHTPRVENTTRSEVFLTDLEVFDIVMKHCEECFTKISNKLILKGKLRMQNRGCFHQISKHVTVHDNLCLWLLNY